MEREFLAKISGKKLGFSDLGKKTGFVMNLNIINTLIPNKLSKLVREILWLDVTQLAKKKKSMKYLYQEHFIFLEHVFFFLQELN